MSTFFFTTAELKTDNTRIQQCMEKLKMEGSINTWQIKAYSGDPVLAVETITISSEELKHKIREGGVDVEFSKPPQAK